MCCITQDCAAIAECDAAGKVEDGGATLFASFYNEVHGCSLKLII